jgi:vancomycin resistance protein VanJ
MNLEVLSTSVKPSGRKSMLAQTFARLLAVCVWGNLLGLVGVWALFHFGGDRWWFATVLLFGPRWVYLVPTIALLPVCLLLRPWLTVLLGLSALVGLFPLMGLELAWSRSSDPGQPSLRVLSYNIQRYSVTDRDFAALLDTIQPDVIALQESAGWVPGGWHMPEGWHVQRAGEMLVASRWPICRTAVSYFGLPKGRGGVVNGLYCVLETPAGVMGFCNLHLDTPRRGLSAVLDPEKGLDLTQTEYAERRIELRRQESAEVARWLSDFREPKIIAGDFNMPVDSTIYRDVWTRYENAFNRSGLGFGYTKQTTIRHRKYGLRIDHVLIDGPWRPTRCWVGPDLGPDHLPLIAELGWE